jgi:hypothetical protein
VTILSNPDYTDVQWTVCCKRYGRKRLLPVLRHTSWGSAANNESLCLDYTVSRPRLESVTSWKKVSSTATRLHLLSVSYTSAAHQDQNCTRWISWESQELSGSCRRWWNLQQQCTTHFSCCPAIGFITHMQSTDVARVQDRSLEHCCPTLTITSPVVIPASSQIHVYRDLLRVLNVNVQLSLYIPWSD